jgi:hypothetical protein
MEVQRLAAIPLFATLPDQELAAVASCAGEQEVDAGAMLVREGEFGHCIYAVESGAADFKRDVWALEDEAPEAARRLRELIGTRTMPAAQ